MVAPVGARRSPRFGRDSVTDPARQRKDRRRRGLSPGVNLSVGWVFVIAWAAVCVVLAVIIFALTVFT
jgi:hypothetical protein